MKFCKLENVSKLIGDESAIVCGMLSYMTQKSWGSQGSVRVGNRVAMAEPTGFEAEARKRQLAGTKPDLPENFPEGKGDSRDQAAVNDLIKSERQKRGADRRGRPQALNLAFQPVQEPRGGAKDTQDGGNRETVRIGKFRGPFEGSV